MTANQVFASLVVIYFISLLACSNAKADNIVCQQTSTTQTICFDTNTKTGETNSSVITTTPDYANGSDSDGYEN